MFGKYRHTVDPKGRLFVPAKLREELGDAFYITPSPDRCLTVYTESSWQKLLEQYDDLSRSKSRSRRVLLANAAKCEPDKQGRFMIPNDLRNFAHINQNVTFIGQGAHAEIWDTAKYDEMEAEMLTPENLLAAMEELGF